MWIHGDYMKALEKRVLLDALDIQDALLHKDLPSSETHEIPISSSTAAERELVEPDTDSCGFPSSQNVSWGFHSPLIYWNCSRSAIEHDADVKQTINDQVYRHSYLNFTLRPSSVFAGKQFVKHKLNASDALVITLFDKTRQGIGKVWEERSVALASRSEGRFDFHPALGRSTGNQLYEFRFKPMSLYDDLGLAAAYGAMAFYFLVSLRKLRALKSKIGLAIAFTIKVRPRTSPRTLLMTFRSTLPLSEASPYVGCSRSIFHASHEKPILS